MNLIGSLQPLRHTYVMRTTKLCTDVQNDSRTLGGRTWQNVVLVQCWGLRIGPGHPKPQCKSKRNTRNLDMLPSDGALHMYTAATPRQSRTNATSLPRRTFIIPRRTCRGPLVWPARQIHRLRLDLFCRYTAWAKWASVTCRRPVNRSLTRRSVAAGIYCHTRHPRCVRMQGPSLYGTVHEAHVDAGACGARLI